MFIKYFFLLILLLISNIAGAISIIRDAEIESVIADLVTPIIKAAKLDANAPNVYIINDSVPNAFVTSGNNIFITSNLLIEIADADAIAAIFAHEIGHIKEEHITRTQQ